MGSEKLGKLQQQILLTLRSDQDGKHHGVCTYTDVVRAIPADRSNIAKSVRNLEEKGLVTLEYSPGGHVLGIGLTRQGWHVVSEIVLSDQRYV